jgi:hypothetical protein
LRPIAPWRSGGAGARGTSVASALQAIKPPSAPDFVHQDSLPAGQAYEAHIFQTRTVPTRDNLHDFFNGLVWLAFPQTKRRLNELQAAEIARTGVAPRAARCATRSRCSTRTARCSMRRPRCGRRWWRATGTRCS